MSNGAHELPSVWELALFAALALVGLIFGAVVFYRILGLVGVGWALVQAARRRVPVGVEGRTPSFHIQGAAAVAVGLVLASAFGAMAWFAPELSCFFSEGRTCK
jgi:hypothetical protein